MNTIDARFVPPQRARTRLTRRQELRAAEAGRMRGSSQLSSNLARAKQYLSAHAYRATQEDLTALWAMLNRLRYWQHSGSLRDSRGMFVDIDIVSTVKSQENDPDEPRGRPSFGCYRVSGCQSFDLVVFPFSLCSTATTTSLITSDIVSHFTIPHRIPPQGHTHPSDHGWRTTAHAAAQRRGTRGIRRSAHYIRCKYCSIRVSHSAGAPGRKSVSGLGTAT